MSKFEAVMCIVNSGFSDTAMDAAKKVGARGGTVMHARGTAPKEAEKIFNVTIQPEKEIVMIIIPTELKKDVLNALYESVGTTTQAQGMVFALPVDEVVGIQK